MFQGLIQAHSKFRKSLISSQFRLDRREIRDPVSCIPSWLRRHAALQTQSRDESIPAGLRDTPAPTDAAARDDKLRAFDVSRGKELWQAALPAGGQATPMSYVAAGRQFVVVAAAATPDWAAHSATPSSPSLCHPALIITRYISEQAGYEPTQFSVASERISKKPDPGR
jgi:hypothetical protein